MTHREVAKVLGSRGRNKQLEDWEKDIYKTHGLADLQWREWKITIDQAYRDSDMAGDIPAAFAPPYFRVGFDQTGSVVTTSISRPRKE